MLHLFMKFFFSSRRRHTRLTCDWSSDVSLPISVASPRAQQQTRPSYGSTTTAVLVDVVVRDKHDRPVMDLRADDFEVFEDDVRQPLGSFTRVAHGSGIGVNLDRKSTRLNSSHMSISYA